MQRAKETKKQAVLKTWENRTMVPKTPQVKNVGREFQRKGATTEKTPSLVATHLPLNDAGLPS